jgi:hypothetical protein
MNRFLLRLTGYVLFLPVVAVLAVSLVLGWFFAQIDRLFAWLYDLTFANPDRLERGQSHESK